MIQPQIFKFKNNRKFDKQTSTVITVLMVQCYFYL